MGTDTIIIISDKNKGGEMNKKILIKKYNLKKKIQ